MAQKSLKELYKEYDDKTLSQKAKAGDDLAFDILYRRALRILRKILNNDDIFDDVASFVDQDMYRIIMKYNPNKSSYYTYICKAMLRRIASYFTKQHLKKNQPNINTVSLDDILSIHDSTIIKDPVFQSIYLFVNSALSKSEEGYFYVELIDYMSQHLNRTQFMIFVLHNIMGYTFVETAQLLGVHQSTVYKNTKIIKAVTKKFLEE